MVGAIRLLKHAVAVVWVVFLLAVLVLLVPVLFTLELWWGSRPTGGPAGVMDEAEEPEEQAGPAAEETEGQSAELAEQVAIPCELLTWSSFRAFSSAKEFVAACLLPLIVMASEEAVCCAEFIRQMHDRDLPGWCTCEILQEAIEQLMPLMATAKSKEASRIGAFLKETMKMYLRWAAHESAYVSDCAGKQGFRCPFDSPLSHVQFQAHALYLGQCLQCAILQNLGSGRYACTRNALSIFEAVAESFLMSEACTLELMPAVRTLVTEGKAPDLGPKAIRLYIFLCNRMACMRRQNRRSTEDINNTQEVTEEPLQEGSPCSEGVPALGQETVQPVHPLPPVPPPAAQPGDSPLIPASQESPQPAARPLPTPSQASPQPAVSPLPTPPQERPQPMPSSPAIPLQQAQPEHPPLPSEVPWPTSALLASAGPLPLGPSSPLEAPRLSPAQPSRSTPLRPQVSEELWALKERFRKQMERSSKIKAFIAAQKANNKMIYHPLRGCRSPCSAS